MLLDQMMDGVEGPVTLFINHVAEQINVNKHALCLILFATSEALHSALPILLLLVISC
jgi:hypothetical protein